MWSESSMSNRSDRLTLVNPENFGKKGASERSAYEILNSHLFINIFGTDPLSFKSGTTLGTPVLSHSNDVLLAGR